MSKALGLIPRTLKNHFQRSADGKTTANLTKMGDKLGIESGLMREGIHELIDSGFLVIIDAEGNEMDQLPDDVTALSFKSHVFTAHPIRQPRLDDTPRGREEKGSEDIVTTKDGEPMRYRAVVVAEKAPKSDGHTGRYLLTVIRDPRGENFNEIEDKAFDLRAEAWDYWDTFTQGLVPYTVDHEATIAQ